MAYEDIYNAASDPAARLRKQVAVAVMAAARDVRYESSGTPNHARRLAWADQVHALGPDVWAARMIWRVMEASAVSTNPTAATDVNVQSQVNALIDYYAGA